MRSDYNDVPLHTLFLLWARHRLSAWLRAMRPEISAASVAALTARDGNPPGA